VTIFTWDLLQAVNDWQRGGDHKQKVRRGNTLKQRAVTLPERFRAADTNCFRHEAHEKDRIWQLLADKSLPETIAGWTTDLAVAKSFKGGVPPPGLQGVIFAVRPPSGSVVLNLAELYADNDFPDAIERHQHHIDGFGDGIGRHGASQSEVVLELHNLSAATILLYGGHSNIRSDIAWALFQREPTEEDLATVDQMLSQAGANPGAWWLSDAGTQNVLARMEPHIERLKDRKARQRRTA
jgi:hypothetical protein